MKSRDECVGRRGESGEFVGEEVSSEGALVNREREG